MDVHALKSNSGTINFKGGSLSRERIEQDLIELMKSCGLLRGPNTCPCMKCAEQFWKNRQLIHCVLRQIFKSKNERANGINMRRLKIKETLEKEKKYEKKRKEAATRKTFPHKKKQAQTSPKSKLSSSSYSENLGEEIPGSCSGLDYNNMLKYSKLFRTRRFYDSKNDISDGSSLDKIFDFCITSKPSDIMSPDSAQEEENSPRDLIDRNISTKESTFENNWITVLLNDFKYISTCLETSQTTGEYIDTQASCSAPSERLQEEMKSMNTIRNTSKYEYLTYPSSAKTQENMENISEPSIYSRLGDCFGKYKEEPKKIPESPVSNLIDKLLDGFQHMTCSPALSFDNLPSRSTKYDGIPLTNIHPDHETSSSYSSSISSHDVLV